MTNDRRSPENTRVFSHISLPHAQSQAADLLALGLVIVVVIIVLLLSRSPGGLGWHR